MLIYYDDDIIVTENTINYGNVCSPVNGLIVRIYDINGFLLICDKQNIHIYYKKYKEYSRMFRFDPFVVNLVNNEIFVIDIANAADRSIDHVKIVTIFTIINDFRKRYGCVLAVNKIKNDWPIVPLLTNIARSFRGFEDIIVAFM